MKRIYLSKEGVKGKGVKFLGEQGRVIISNDSIQSPLQEINIDVFAGIGDSYARLDDCIITVTNGKESIQLTSFDSFFKQLKK